MGGSQIVERMRRDAIGRMDDGTFDLALGSVVFLLGAGLDLGRIAVLPLVFVPLAVAALRQQLVWPRAGFARERTRDVAELGLLFGLSFLGLLALAATIGVPGLAGSATEAAMARTRVVSAAALLALPGLLGLLAYRLRRPRCGAYALGILLAFAAGLALGEEPRAWALALLGLAIAGTGALRLRRFVLEHPRPARDEP